MGAPTIAPQFTTDTAGQIASTIQEIAALAAAILGAIPATASANTLVGPLAVLAVKAVEAYHDAAKIAVTPESIALLFPDTTPLVPPKKG